MYINPVIITGSAHFKARIMYNGVWSPLSEQNFVVPDNNKDIKITEVHYHPSNQNEVQDSVFEFIELKNTGNSTIYLEGMKFSDGIRYRFSSECWLKPDELIVLASNSNYFYERYHFMPFYQYNGHLDNSGEELVLLSAERDTLCSFAYDDENGWPESPDGEGRSLVPVDMDPTGNQRLPEFWRASWNTGGSPGTDDVYRSERSSTEIISVFQNYPNPFRESTTIPYQLHISASVKITVFNLSGKPVSILEYENKSQGFYRTEWNGFEQNGKKAPGGLYFYRIEAISAGGKSIITMKALLIRN